MRMVEWTRPAQFPNFGRHNETGELFAMFPPTIPERTQIRASGFSHGGQIGRLQKSGYSEEQGFRVIAIFLEQCQRQSARSS